MSIMDDLRSRWFAATLSIAAALFFTGALVFSAMTYVSVMDARQNIRLASAIETAEELQNGSLLISLTIELENPSRQVLHITSLSWSVRIYNWSHPDGALIPVAFVYTVPTEFADVGKGEVKVYDYEQLVSDPEVLSNIRGFINHSASEDVDYMLETVPYTHDFRVAAWLGDYEHDYDYSKELYLNDMVKIERRYFGGSYT
ncbi:MAG: hypothetical protein JSU93_02685 [Methanobacteriota archaeon]|nr:MAG: hypothetical protein JSU93_02685 [Euryarchaeota archaeon]